MRFSGIVNRDFKRNLIENLFLFLELFFSLLENIRICDVGVFSCKRYYRFDVL